MRWSHLALQPGAPPEPTAGMLPLSMPDVVVRTFDTPGFAGMTFFEVRAKSIINRVPGSSRLPFEWTINPFRGCDHACTYCFARKSHTYLDLDPGDDFNRKVVVKVNARELIRKELAAPRWEGHHIAMGTNVDCYQRAKGKYELMREILSGLRDFANPFSILTKGTLILRDLDLLRQSAEVTEVGLAVSVGFVDHELWRSVEPGAPSPRRRLDVVRQLASAGLRVGVLMAPILPGLTDDDASINATVAAIAAAGAASVTPLSLHLRPGAREWYQRWLSQEHPELAGRYRELYGRRSYAPENYQRDVAERVRAAARRCGIGGGTDHRTTTRPERPRPAPGHRHAAVPAPAQPTLW